MVFLNRPLDFSPLEALEFAHLKVIGDPVINVAVWGNNLEHSNQAVAFEMHDAPLSADIDRTDGSIAAAVGVDQPIAFEPGQPASAITGNQLEVG